MGKKRTKPCEHCNSTIKVNVQHNCPPDKDGTIKSTFWGNKWE